MLKTEWELHCKWMEAETKIVLLREVIQKCLVCFDEDSEVHDICIVALEQLCEEKEK